MPDDHDAAVNELYVEMDRVTNVELGESGQENKQRSRRWSIDRSFQHVRRHSRMESGYVTSQHAAQGWVLGLTEWALPGKYEIGQRPSAVSPILDQDRETGIVEEEYIPSAVSMALRAMYQLRIVRMVIEDSKVLNRLSQKIGEMNTSPNSVDDIPKFIDLYGINVEEAEKPVEEYTSFNE